MPTLLALIFSTQEQGALLIGGHGPGIDIGIIHNKHGDYGLVRHFKRRGEQCAIELQIGRFNHRVNAMKLMENPLALNIVLLSRASGYY